MIGPGLTVAVMQLHGHPLSGNSHKVRLLLAALALPYEERLVDVTAGAHKRPDFLALNPRGQVPVLVDGELAVHDAQAILVYLARRHDRTGAWLPDAPADAARIVGWLSFAANEIQNGVHAARIHQLLGVPVPLDHVAAVAHASLRVLDEQLRHRSFLECERPTLADLACFPCVALAPEGKIDLAAYPHVQRWAARIRSLPYYVGMPGLEAQR